MAKLFPDSKTFVDMHMKEKPGNHFVFAPDNNPIRSLGISDFHQCLPQKIIQSDQWKFEIFNRFIGVHWSLIYEDHFHHKIY